MRFIILVKAKKDSEAGVMPAQEMLTAMADYHEQLAKAGVLLDGNGLHPRWPSGRTPATIALSSVSCVAAAVAEAAAP
jgi:hypothetical protein